MLTLNDGRSELWQWDTGRTLTVDADCSQVHFSNKVFGRSIDVDVVDGAAIIPDVLLQTDKDFTVWAFVGTAENGYTKISKTFKVNRRNKPADYVFTPVEQTNIAEIAAIAQSVRDDADNGLFDGAQGPAGPIGPVGPQGEQGLTGPKGDTGPQGEQGPQGLQGVQGEKGEKGEKGDKGDTGDIGPQGPQSAPGENGKDAVVDSTLTQSGQAADAAEVGNKINEIKSDLTELDSKVFGNTIETDVTGEVLSGVIVDTRSGVESRKFPYSSCTGFIDVSDNADYCYSGKIYNYIGVAGYDLDGNFVAPVLSDTNEVFTDQKLTIPDGVSKIRASSYSPSENTRFPLQVVKKEKTSNLVDEVLSLNNEVSSLNKNKENITIVNHIYVATTGSDTSGDGTLSNPFATIYHANDKITDATEMNQYIIHVADGIYTDLQTRYAGIQTHENYEGVKCKPWVVYEGNVRHPENVVIQWDGKTGYGEDFNYNEHAVHLCPFHITGSNGWTTGHKEIRGFTFDCKNTRYALHVEMSGYGYGVTWEVSDCIFVWHGVPDCSDITYQIPAIGTGSGHYEKGHLLRCKIVNDSGITDGFRNHDSRWVYGSLLGNLPHIGAEIIIEDCVFNGGDSGDTNITFRTIYGNGLVDGYNRFSIINCVGINKLAYGLSGGSTECEWRANIKCSKIVTNQFSNESLLQ